MPTAKGISIIIIWVFNIPIWMQCIMAVMAMSYYTSCFRNNEGNWNKSWGEVQQWHATCTCISKPWHRYYIQVHTVFHSRQLHSIVWVMNTDYAQWLGKICTTMYYIKTCHAGFSTELRSTCKYSNSRLTNQKGGVTTMSFLTRRFSTIIPTTTKHRTKVFAHN